jgi:hypothetical protein
MTSSNDIPRLKRLKIQIGQAKTQIRQPKALRILCQLIMVRPTSLIVHHLLVGCLKDGKTSESILDCDLPNGMFSVVGKYLS